MDKNKKGSDKIVVATNRKARHQYEIFDVMEAGLSLKGPEVKSLRAGELRLTGAFARIDGNEIFIHNLYIGPYAQNTAEDIDPIRTRKLLMRRREIDRLRGRQEAKGLTLIPLELYFLKGWAKVTLALARSRRGPDKRETLKKKQTSRELERSFKGKFKH
ncbi:SsrA-binding protein SmpB [Elusimicrobiota bacterium]